VATILFLFRVVKISVCVKDKEGHDDDDSKGMTAFFVERLGRCSLDRTVFRGKANSRVSLSGSVR